MPTHTSKIATNFNNKLDSPYFIHVDFAPKTGIPESILDKTVYEITTEDNSHAPVTVKLEDLARMELQNVCDIITWQSHGMNSREYLGYLMSKHKDLTGHTPMAVYLFRKIEKVA